MIAWITTLCNSRKLWAMQFRATHTGWVMVESSDKLSLEKGLANHLSILAWRTPRSLLWWVSKLKYVQRWFAYVYKISVSFRSTIEMIMQSKRKLIFIWLPFCLSNPANSASKEGWCDVSMTSLIFSLILGSFQNASVHGPMSLLSMSPKTVGHKLQKFRKQKKQKLGQIQSSSNFKTFKSSIHLFLLRFSKTSFCWLQS